MKATPQEKKGLYRLVFVTALPIVLQNLLDAAVNSADVLMLNFVGQSSISASSLATQVTSVMFYFFYGIGTGIAMMGSQYWGKKDMESLNKIRAIGFRFSILFSLLFTSATLLIPELLMKIFTPDAELIKLGSQYLRIVGPGFIFWSICSSYCSLLRSIGRAKEGTIIEGITLVTNVVLNAFFIFVMKMGLPGVALATTISRIFSLLVCLYYSSKVEIKLSLKGMFKGYQLLEKDFMTMALPATLNDIVWGVGYSMYSVVMGHMGNDMVAAFSMVSVVRNLSFVLCFGLASAALIIVGNKLGADQIEEAKTASHTMLRLTVAAGALGGLLVALLIHPVTLVANITDTAKSYLRFMMLINIYYVMGGAVNTTLIAGVFRAGGDSKFGLYCDAIDMWAWGVPLAFLAAFVFKLSPFWVYFLMCTDEFVKWPFVFKRYYSYKWARNITRDSQ